MKKEEIKARLELLYTVLKYCADNVKTFDIGERIMINQERASLMNKLTSLNYKSTKEKLFDFKVSTKIEEKISTIKSKITQKIPMPYIFDEN